MSSEAPQGVDATLDQLERAIAKLADTRADLDQLTAAYEEAQRLVAQAETELAELKARLEPT